jgi:yecA family protein
MRKLPVDLDELALALEGDDFGSDAAYWFDTVTGDVLFVSSDLEEDQELRAQVGDGFPGRFVRIDSIGTREVFRMMENFVRILPAGQVRDNLESSLRGPRPFRRFKDSLTDGKAREQWFAFRNKAFRHSAIAWLAALGIQPGGAEDSKTGETEFERLGVEENDERTFEDNSEVSSGKEEIGDEEIDFQDQLGLPISDEEEDELAGFVETFSGGRFDFPKLHGLLTAFAVGPGECSPSGIAQVLSGKSKVEEPISNNFSRSERILGLIARLQNEIVLDLDGDIFEPESFEREHPSGEIYPDTFSWCEGFVLGIDHDAEVWEKWSIDGRRKRVTSAIAAAANREFRTSGICPETPEKMWALYDLIERVVPLIRSFWRLESGLDEVVGDTSLFPK